MKILITTTTFGEYDYTPLTMLKEAGYEVVPNPYKKKLTKQEAFSLYSSDVCAVIAGLETIDKDIIANAAQLKVISRCGTGLENVDVDFAKKRGIKVFNTPDAPVDAVAELTVGLILSLCRGISLADREVHAGIWKKRMGCLLNGKKVGIIGFGRIGKRAGILLKALGAKILYYDPFVEPSPSDSFRKAELYELLREADIVSLHLSYSENNRNLIGKKELSLMKKGALLVNVSRGGVVDEKALYTALKEGHLAGAGLDVFENEPYNGDLKGLDNVIMTPHIGSYAKEARIKMEIEAAENLIRALGEIRNA